jgi:hypothetical protein
VLRGINVRWNVSGAPAAANSSPAWSALPPNDWLRALGITAPFLHIDSTGYRHRRV